MIRRSLLILLIPLILVPGFLLLRTKTTPDLFVDVASEVGLDFRHWNGMSGRLYMSEILGPGVAFVDYDQDGDLDVLAVQGALLDPSDTPLVPAPTPLRTRLFRNDGGAAAPLRFTDVTTASHLDVQGYGMGVAVGDVDNDGWPDLYFTQLGVNTLWRNRGDGTFEGITISAGVGDPAFGTSASWFDFDRDGWLDLFVANYVEFGPATHKKCGAESSAADYCGPRSFTPAMDRLWRNRGDGTFDDVTLVAGLGRNDGPGLGVIATDFDLDGFLDLYVANDGTDNQLWHNRGNGTFVDVAAETASAVDMTGQPEGSMGVDAADIDEDGDEDIIVMNLDEETNTLYRNSGNGFYEDVTLSAGLARPSLGLTAFGTGFFDFDNDTDLDLFVANGAVHRLAEQIAPDELLPLRQRQQIFENVGDGRFVEISGQAGSYFQQREIGRGVAFGDVDNDGDTDLLVSNNNGPLRLLLNRGTPTHHWLGLRLLTDQRDALGARIIIERDHQPSLVRRVKTDGSYLSANDPRVLVGLGPDVQSPTVIVEWVSGRRERFTGLVIDRYQTLREGEGTIASAELTTVQQGKKQQQSEIPARGTPSQESTTTALAGTPLEVVTLSTAETLEPQVKAQLQAAWDHLEQVQKHHVQAEQRAQAWGSLGELFHAYRLMQTAPAYRNALRLAPRTHRWHYLLGLYSLDRRALDAAVSELHLALDLAPNDVPTRLRLAEAQLRRGEWEVAAAHLASLLVAVPGLAPAHLLRAQIATATHEYQLAAAHYEQALRLQPHATQLHSAAAAAYRALGQIEPMQHHLQQRGDGLVSIEDPLLLEVESRIRSSHHFQEIGERALRAGQTTEAVTAFRRATELAPDDLEAQINLAVALAQTGAKPEALNRLEHLRSQAPENSRLLFSLGVLHAQQGEEETALADYRSALARRPDFRDAHLNLANLLLRRGDSNAASTHYQRVVELDPHDGRVRSLLVRTLTAAGRHLEAFLTAEQAARDFPQEAGVLEALARLLAASPLMERRDGTRAVIFAERAFAVARTFSSVEALAMAYAAKGETGTAIRWQETAIAVARKAGQQHLELPLQEALERYRRGEAAKQPWGY